MSRRTSRKKQTASLRQIYLSVGIPVAVLILAFIIYSFSSGGTKKTANRFDTHSYMNAGSGSAGNRYTIEGIVDNIRTVDNDTLLSVIPSGATDRNARLPLMLKKDVAGQTNITRNDTYIFEVLCRNGRDTGGEAVKGILLIKTVTPK